jgi:hypothetical protein
MEDLSKTCTQFFWLMDKDDRNAFFDNYHLAISFAINKALRKHFPGSKKRFTANFKIRVFELVSEIVTGIRLRPTYLLRKKDKLFPRKKRDILEVLRRREKENMKTKSRAKKKRPEETEIPLKSKGFYSSSEEEEQGLEAEFNDLENFEDITAATKSLGAGDAILLKHNDKKKSDRKNNKSIMISTNRLQDEEEEEREEEEEERSEKERTLTKKPDKEKQASVVEAMLKPSPRFESELYRNAVTQLMLAKHESSPSRSNSRLSENDADDEQDGTQSRRRIERRDKTRFWSTYTMSPLIGRFVPEPIEMQCSSNGRLIKRNGFQNPHFFGGSMDEKRRRKQIIEYNRKWINPPSMEHLTMSNNMHKKWEQAMAEKAKKSEKPTQADIKKKQDDEDALLQKEKMEILNDKTGVRIKKLCSDMIGTHKEVSKKGRLETKYELEEAHHFRGTTLALYASETSQEVSKDIKKIDRLFEKLKL